MKPETIHQYRTVPEGPLLGDAYCRSARTMATIAANLFGMQIPVTETGISGQLAASTESFAHNSKSRDRPDDSSSDDDEPSSRQHHEWVSILLGAFLIVAGTALVIYASIIGMFARFHSNGEMMAIDLDFSQFETIARNMDHRLKHVLIFDPSIKISMQLSRPNRLQSLHIGVPTIAERLRLRRDQDAFAGFLKDVSRFVEIWVTKIRVYRISTFPIISPGECIFSWRGAAVSVLGYNMYNIRWGLWGVAFSGAGDKFGNRDESTLYHFAVRSLPTCDTVNSYCRGSEYEVEEVLSSTGNPAAFVPSHGLWIPLFVLACVIGFIAVVLLSSESPWALLGLILFVIFVFLEAKALQLYYGWVSF